MLPTGGSSPRERGTVANFIVCCVQHRFIPARAGNRPRQSRSPTRSAVHPRASGEQFWREGGHSLSSGSSPRERGTEAAARQAGVGDRFIPARAGNKHRCRHRRARSPVHPRASGEQANTVAPAALASGSSPRERGTSTYLQTATVTTRFIPARAGNKSMCRHR